MRIRNKKGFTLIELLAVIIILGVLLLIAVPSVSKYIESSRKRTYVNQVKTILNAVVTSINARELPYTPGKDEGVIIPFSEVNLEKSSSKTVSPYAKYISDKSYVVVTFDGNDYNYFVAALDESGHGIPLVNEKSLSTDIITGNTQTLNNNVYSTTTIKSGQIISADYLTMKYISSSGEYIKVKICQVPYARGDIIQLKDGSKWYTIEASDENNEMIHLVSYYHMDTLAANYGEQSGSKTGPTIQFHRNQSITTYGPSADIYSVAESIVASTRVKLTASGLDMTNAVVKMPNVSDFGCNIDTGCPAPYTLPYLAGNDAFWTQDSKTGWVVTISSSGVGNATAENYRGIRVVLQILKSNIDKIATRELNA